MCINFPFFNLYYNDFNRKKNIEMIRFSNNENNIFYALNMCLYIIEEECEYGHDYNGYGYVNMVI